MKRIRFGSRLLSLEYLAPGAVQTADRLDFEWRRFGDHGYFLAARTPKRPR